MIDAANLWLYFVVVFGIVALPGMDMAYVMGSSMLGGRRAGLAAVAGIVAGGVCHVAMGALGIAAILKIWPPLYDIMLAAGAAYIGWMGISLLRSSAMFEPGQLSAAVAPAVAFRRALITSLVNPKAYMFMLAVFPQFLQPGHGAIWLQAGVLGVITWLTQAGVYGGLAVVAGQASGWFEGNPQAAQWTARGMGAVLIGVAALTAAKLFMP
jgi:threonine/homoserine/homoserine lactone efflux protein